MFKLYYDKKVYKYLKVYNVESLTIREKSEKMYGYNLNFRMSETCIISDVNYITLENLMIALASFFTAISGIIVIITSYHSRKNYET